MSAKTKAVAIRTSLAAPANDVRPRAVDVSLPGKRRDAAATRARILEAAMSEFAEKGLDARIEDIAEIAGANRRMAYFYFGSKEGLYLAALEATYLELVAVEQAIKVDVMQPGAAIAALVAAKFDHYVKFPRYIEFLKIENLYQGKHIRMSERIREMRGPLVELVAKALGRGQELGIFRADVEALDLYLSICALGFFTFSNRFTLGVIFDVDLMAPQEIARRRDIVVDMILAYLDPRTERSPKVTAPRPHGETARDTHAGGKSRGAARPAKRSRCGKPGT